jgi:hypothetical protein
MTPKRITFRGVGLVVFTAVSVVLALTVGGAFASGHASAGELPDCALGGASCDNIGMTEGWFEGQTLLFQYSHDFFCATPPSSGATSKCEAGAEAEVLPPSGEVGEEVYVVVPIGFTPPESTLQCPVAGRCIDHPRTIDLTRVFGPGHANDLVAPHSHVIEDLEEFNGVWWPVELIGVTSMEGWNAIVRGKSLDAVRRQQQLGRATADIPTNLFLFFEVFNPED